MATFLAAPFRDCEGIDRAGNARVCLKVRSAQTLVFRRVLRPQSRTFLT